MVGIIFYESQKVISIAHGLAGVVKNKFLQWEVEQYNEFFRVKIDANGLMLQKKSFLFTAYLFGHTSLLIALVLLAQVQAALVKQTSHFLFSVCIKDLYQV